jgi:predicted dehydrogenase
MIDAFRGRGVPLFVAYYRRAFPRFLAARELLRGGAIGKPTSVYIFHYDRLLVGDAARIWRVDPAIAGAGLFLDLASHGLDLLDFLLGPICGISGEAVNTGGTYAAEDVTAASFRFESGAVGTGIWNFNAAHSDNGIVITGSAGTLRMPVFTDADLVVVHDGREQVLPFRNPPHVHQPFVQTVVDALLGRGTCESTGETGARTSWVMDRCIEGYYARTHLPLPHRPVTVAGRPPRE